MANRYVSSVAAALVSAWAASHTYSAGAIVNQLSAPGFGGIRCFQTAAGGTSGSTEPRWNLSPGGSTVTDGTITDWTEVTGKESLQSPGSWQATYSDLSSVFSWYASGTPVKVAGGSGYVVGDLLQWNGGTPISGCSAIIRVNSVSSGAVLTFTMFSGGAYLATPGASTAATTALTGSGSGATATITPATILVLATDVAVVASSHAESYSVPTTINPPGTIIAKTYVVSVDESGTGHIPPTNVDLKVGASITTTGTSALSFTSNIYVWGFILIVGTGSGISSLSLGSASSNFEQYWDNCQFSLGNSTGTGVIGTAGAITWNNCSLKFGLLTQTIRIGSTQFVWRNTANPFISGSIFPTTLFSANTAGSTLIEGVDLSALGSAKTIFPASGSPFQWLLKDCKLNASVVIAAVPLSPCELYMVRSDSAGTNYKFAKFDYCGTETTESSITRVGGASTGATQFTKKLVTNANSKWQFPFDTIPLSVWNNVVSPTARTVTVYGTINSASLPNTDEIWIEVEYLGDSGSPLGSFITSTKATFLDTGSAVASDSSSWNGGGSGAGWSPFALSITLTAQLIGPLTIRVKAAKASTTYYIDPLPVLT